MLGCRAPLQVRNGIAEANSFPCGCQQFCRIPIAIFRVHGGTLRVVGRVAPDEAASRWCRPSLTQRTHVSTLIQSPESRRYGCDPGVTCPGNRAGQQQDHFPTESRSNLAEPNVNGRTAGKASSETERGERRGQGQADLPAEQPAPSPCARLPLAHAYPGRASHCVWPPPQGSPRAICLI
jgi:hypothetical protein